MLLLLCAVFGNAANAITWSNQTITNNAPGAGSVLAMDITGNGYLDVIYVNNGTTISFYENQGPAKGCFSNSRQQNVSSDPVGALSIDAADFDNDGRLDVVTAIGEHDAIVWYKNLGSGKFSGRMTISNTQHFPLSVVATDIDKDGLVDVLAASGEDNVVAWYRNQGSGFSSANVITASTDLDDPHMVFAADITGDGYVDVLVSCAFGVNDSVVWYENQGPSQNFFANSKVQLITAQASDPDSVFAADIDGDGDLDVLSSSSSKIAWYENRGRAQGFVTNSPQKVISNQTKYPVSAIASDIDNDGDLDVVAATWTDNTVIWFENQGAANGYFPLNTPLQVIGQLANTSSVVAADLDADNVMDVAATSSTWTGGVAWFDQK